MAKITVLGGCGAIVEHGDENGVARKMDIGTVRLRKIKTGGVK